MTEVSYKSAGAETESRARFMGKVAVITGAARGMGAWHARLFAQEGCKVVVTDVLENEGRQVAEEIGEDAIFLKHDVTDLESWSNVLTVAENKFGPVTILINNAGIAGPFTHTAELSVRDYLAVLDVNANGVFYGMKSVIPGMIDAGGGAIVNISSVGGFNHIEGLPNIAYTASKFALRGMTKAAAVEYASRNIRINSVHPGGVLTPMALEATTQDAIDTFVGKIPMGRTGNPQEISRVVLFLASDEASYMTGSAVLVDGGILR